MTYQPFEIHQPIDTTCGVVFASPHSGHAYSAKFLSDSILNKHTIRSSEDAHVDELFKAAPEFGAPLIKAHAPRAFLDLNRAPNEWDAALIRGAKRNILNPRVASGLGVIPRVVAGGRPIYSGKISMAEAEKRVQEIWHPYHAALKSLLDHAVRTFGYAILIDCHSMPREAVACSKISGAQCPQIVLGDRFGKSADEGVTQILQTAFEDAGLRVARNMPFAGAYIAKTYGKPLKGIHVVQIEIDRSLYMDEATLEPTLGFDALQSILNNVVKAITAYRPGQALMAAE